MMEEKDICDICQRPILAGEMTNIQTKPYRKTHWQCYRRWVEEKVKEGMDNYELKRQRRLQVA